MFFKLVLDPTREAAARRSTFKNAFRIFGATIVGGAILFNALDYSVDGVSCPNRGGDCRSTSVVAAFSDNLFAVIFGTVLILLALLELFAFLTKESRESSDKTSDENR
jgi:hypothetical protein